MIATVAFGLLVVLALIYVMAPLLGRGRVPASGGACDATAEVPRRVCPACAVAAAGDARYCVRCGAPLSAPP